MDVTESLSDESHLIQRIEAYLDCHACSEEAARFEKELEEEACARLERQGMLTWDFDTKYPFFGNRGASILIQNLELDWRSTWEWLMQRCQDIPAGAIFNFEVQDSIRGKVMNRGATVCRRVATSVGIWELVA